MSSIPTAFRQLTIITTLIESLAVFVTSKPKRRAAVIHECRAYNRDNDTGRASWCSAASVAGNLQHWRSEPSRGEFCAGIAFRCRLRLFVRRQLCMENAREAKCVLEANGRRFEPAEIGMPFHGEVLADGRTKMQQVLTIADWAQEQRFPKMQEFLAGLGIASTCALPLSRPDRRIGVLEFGSSRPNAYTQDDVAFLSIVADQIALAIDAAVNFMSSEIAESRLKLLLELTNSVVSSLEFRDVLRALPASVRRVMQCDGVGLMLLDGTGKNLRRFANDFSEGSVFKEYDDTKLFPIEGSLIGKAFQTGTSVVGNPAELPPEFFENTEQQQAVVREIKSICFVPLISRGRRALGVLGLGKGQEDGFRKGDLEFLMQVANQVAIAVENAMAYKEIANLKDRLAQEKLYLEDEIRGESDFEGIVGQSSALRHVLNLVETVAPSDSTVLLLGETGTGKELIARAIHDRSRRKERTLVRLNCAAIPTGLLESELFGHEKGAFTGAISQKIGRLELADQGTLFLDEVGDIPFEVQPKLLRALQEREFERLGKQSDQESRHPPGSCHQPRPGKNDRRPGIPQ